MFLYFRWLFLVYLFLIGGCQTTAYQEKNSGQPSPGYQTSEIKDSAPLGPIPTFFKAIIPKNEALSRYGNPASYKVSGKVYHVLPTSHGYHARGVASWYASKFHKQRTSSGEPYNMYALTAAHRTLPLPTYLKVKNLDNGREIIVKVNDRGPFHSDRILDLSYGSAVKLGVFPKGTARVEIQAIDNNWQGKPRVGHYYVQAGAFSSQYLAQQYKRQCQSWTRQNTLIDRYRGRYIVKVGPLASHGMGEQVRTLLARHGIKGSFIALGA